MTQGDGMAEVTEADRAEATELMWQIRNGASAEVVAAALAELREEARAPFLALADEAERQPKGYWFVASSQIRRAAEVTE